MDDKCVVCGKAIGGKEVDGISINEPCFPVPGGQWVDGQWSAGYECLSCHEAKASK